jgi:AraC-like DNA-binding protein
MTAPPEHFADRPAPIRDAGTQPHDLLSEVLRSVRLNGERIVSYAPPPEFSIGFADIGSLHIVEQGDLMLRVDADPDVKYLSRGDVVLLPRGDRHTITDVGTRPHGNVPTDAPGPVRWLCGTFTIGDPQASHLLGSLPAAIILRGAEGPALEGLDVARRMLVVEMQSPSQGSAVMVARILDLVFIQILRAWAAGTEAEPNWLAGALDPQIGLALSAIHRAPGNDWTVEDMARACNLSRSAFAARFLAHVGKPPATYLAHVRLDAACNRLRETPLPVALIAKNVGYTSEAAFSRAFKNRYGIPPARWRQDGRTHHA